MCSELIRRAVRSAMSLRGFSFPFPETRLIKAGNLTYKFKIRGGSSFRGEKVMRGNRFSQELEEIIRTVLGNLDSLQPFSSAHFNVFPYKKRWKAASKSTCKHGKNKLRAYPFSLILYLEKNTQHEEAKRAAEKLSPAQSKHRRRDSPLEEAIIKDLFSDMEVESKAAVVGGLSLLCPHAERDDPGCVAKRCDGLQQSTGSGTPDEEQPEEEEEEEGPVRPGILTRLASHIFPFSLFFRDPEGF